MKAAEIYYLIICCAQKQPISTKITLKTVKNVENIKNCFKVTNTTKQTKRLANKKTEI